MNISSAYIEITNICNLDCRTCYNRSGKNHARQELSFSNFVQIVERLVHDFGCNRILLSGGEPTLHTEFEQILNYLLASDLGVGIVTNGTTNCEALREAYHSHPKLTLQVSLDGSCDEINTQTRGHGNFDKAVNFLSQLNCPDNPPILKMVISQNNLHDVEAYYRFARSLGCMPDYSFINGMGNATDAWDSLELTAQQKLSVLRTLDRLNQEYNISVSLPLCTSQCPFSDPDQPLSVLVKSDGMMLPCQILYDNTYALGNLLSDPTSVIAQNHLKLAELARKREAHDAKCHKCLVRVQCRKGCMALALMKNQDPTADDGECDFRKLQLLGYDIKQLIDRY